MRGGGAAIPVPPARRPALQYVAAQLCSGSIWSDVCSRRGSEASRPLWGRDALIPVGWRRSGPERTLMVLSSRAILGAQIKGDRDGVSVRL